LQVVGDSPSSASAARIVLVSGDKLLRDAAQARVSSSNVHILESIDSLKDLVNTLGSAIDEQFIASIRVKAEQLFYKHKDENTLYYNAGISTSLHQALLQAKPTLPVGSERYSIEKWGLKPPQFVRKQGQRIYWSTRFEARLKALKTAPQPETPRFFYSWRGVPSYVEANLSNVTDVSSGTVLMPQTGQVEFSNVAPDLYQSTARDVAGKAVTSFGTNEDQVVGYGTANLDVSWSHSVTTSKTLTRPKVENVNFVEVIWE
jgi:hypothetical protein